MEEKSFIEYILSADLKFLQSREPFLDVYYSGYLGLFVPCLMVASLTVFLLALFQVLPGRRHIAGILLTLGMVSALSGLSSSWLNFGVLPERGSEIIRDSAGEVPSPGSGREAAVIALPLLLGTLNLAGNLTGCLYLAFFWGGRALTRREEDAE